jgi:hypothetical protein
MDHTWKSNRTGTSEQDLYSLATYSFREIVAKWEIKLPVEEGMGTKKRMINKNNPNKSRKEKSNFSICSETFVIRRSASLIRIRAPHV